ncbi:MAG: LamG domain-containing protein [Chitinophagaceae bacterium]|nr:LamG domain-containing protein [Chitinophagaceae bacterium]
MKILFIACLIMAICSCNKDLGNENLTKIPCLPNSLSNYVLAFYPFSKGTINDISGNNHHLINTTTAKPTSDRNLNDSCAYEFDNLPTSSEYITTSATNFLNSLSEFSVSFWYQPKDTSRNGIEFESLINRGMGGSCPNRIGQWSIALYDCRKAVFGRTNSVWDKDITNFNCQQEVITRTDIWHHLVATYNQNGIEMKIYRNGILQEFSSGNANCGSGNPSYQDIGDLFLGKDYTGKIDDVIIFNKTLTQQEVNILFNLETCCEN